MMFFYIILFFVLFFVVFCLFTNKYTNPYKLVMVFGKKGCGKTTNMAKLASRAIRKGIPVFSSCPIAGTRAIDPRTFTLHSLPEGSLVLIDEAGMCYDNRKFKTFPDHARDWFKLQRHYKCTVYLFSQDFDIDLKLRNLTDEMYLTRKVFRVFSVSRKIRRSIVLNNSTAEAPSNIADNLEFVPLFCPGAIRVTFIPHWVKWFDSFDAPKLQDMEYQQYPIAIPTKKYKNIFKSLCTLPMYIHPSLWYNGIIEKGKSALAKKKRG